MNETIGSTGNGGMTERALQGATTRLNDRHTDLIGTVASAVGRPTDQLRAWQRDAFARYVDEAASSLQRLSARVRQKDVGELLRDAQQFAKRRPAVLIGSAFAIGLLGAGFLKLRDRRHAMAGRNYRSSSLGNMGRL